MGISVSFRGCQPDPALRTQALAFARTFAEDMEWHAEAIDEVLDAEGVLDGRGLPEPRRRGLLLLPHFACDPLPLVFEESTGTLVEAYVQAGADGRIRLSAEPFVKTHFAGAAVHAEVCEFLKELKARFVPDLEVDDETGFVAHGDRERLEAALEEAWSEIRRSVEEAQPADGELFEVGGLVFRREAHGGDAPPAEPIAPDRRRAIEQVTTHLMTRYGGFGLDLDWSERSVDDLDLILLEADQGEAFTDREDAETEALVHGLGAYFGQLVTRHLGGHWEEDPDEGLRLADVGGIGLIVDPFQVATERLVHGPAFSFANHYRLYQDLVRHIPA